MENLPYVREELAGGNAPALFSTMAMHNVNLYKFASAQRRRGRPQTASEAERANGYTDASGRYVLSGGLKPWHMRVVDFLLANPGAKIIDIARTFGVSPEWLGRLMKTDAFLEYYENRMAQHQDLVGVQVVSQIQEVATKALTRISEKLDNRDLEIGEAQSAAEMALKNLGFTAPQSQVSMKVKGRDGSETTMTVSSQAAQQARLRMNERMKENTKKLSVQEDNWQHVTSDLEVGVGEIEEMEDAILLDED